MKILFWAELFWPLIGGVEVRLLYLLEKLQREGHVCAVLTNRVAEAPIAYEEWNGIPIHRLDFRQALLERDVRRLRTLQTQALRIKEQFSPEIEHVVCTGPTIVVQQICHRMFPRPVLATLHCDYGDLFRSHSNEALLTMFRQASIVVALSQPMQRDLLARFPALADHLEVLPSGLPWPVTEPKTLPFAPPFLLCLGRLVRDKGFDLALHALALLSLRHPDLRLTIAGDGVERKELEQVTRELGLDQRVTFLGRVEPAAVPDLLNRATIVLVPSRNEEPSAVVLREAAQMARAIVASNVGGTYELIEHGVNGLLVEKENPAAIAIALDRLLSHPKEAQALGAAARLRARNQFDFQRYFDHLLDLYRLAQSRFAANLPSPF